jgi:DNA-binding response OmpR family regulator
MERVAFPVPPMSPPPLPAPDLRLASALVIDPNAGSRALIVAQLRDLGVAEIRQSRRTTDARQQLEAQTFDLVLCERDFPDEDITGQDLLDDLRRGGMLPFATIFIMVTAEASFSKVAEAAESMLDSYLLKPFTPAALLDRITLARRRKVSMHGIYQAIEVQDFRRAATLCRLRFNDRGEHHMFAARVGAEILLRQAHFEEALQLYVEASEREPLPWTRLGQARVLLEMGQPQKARPVLESLLEDAPDYADACDNLARCLLELGQFEQALQVHEQATRLTPASIARLQRHGMLAYYLGQGPVAVDLLQRATRLGLGSKMFDGQTLVLLALASFESGDSRQMQVYLGDLRRMVQRNPESVRLQRMLDTLAVPAALVATGPGDALAALDWLAQGLPQPDFDFEAACNLLTLVALLEARGLAMPAANEMVAAVGSRFATSRALCELLAGAVRQHPNHVETLKQCNTQVLRLLEQAMAPSIGGAPEAAVDKLLSEGLRSLNAKVVETAWLVCLRYQALIPQAEDLKARIQPWRAALGSAYNKPVLGDRNMRQSGGVSLRGMGCAPLQPTMARA